MKDKILVWISPDIMHYFIPYCIHSKSLKHISPIPNGENDILESIRFLIYSSNGNLSYIILYLDFTGSKTFHSPPLCSV